jgi:hypothetical protein
LATSARSLTLTSSVSKRLSLERALSISILLYTRSENDRRKAGEVAGWDGTEIGIEGNNIQPTLE